ncbi:HD domain-containing protein [Agrobacterium vitis]|nr:HD-GYP domain-containing protein [Agrobacterium vitis]MCF1501834.1 HD-GYP domain-containing protein [Allorhizobium sp. Av2]KAA3520790.1 HD-GYP domain-containing protein [Agrobacterium vitis]MUO81557.1 HD domain-containing protein [Agrobacterium vitis]MUO95795.1 HD domain-containing protein [Agrobacterium vitis]
MFVEELEGTALDPAKPHGRFLIKSSLDLDRMMASHAISVVIDTQKGIDTDTAFPPEGLNPAAFQAHLHSFFSGEQIALAQRAIEETRPYVRNVLVQAQLHHAFQFDSACLAVEKVMSDAMSTTSALIGVAKLKDKDEGTFLHSLAVSALMITFGRNLGLNEEKIRLLGLGGLVHDLGKMVLPVELLRKPGKLTADELALVRTHPQRGYEMLKKEPYVSNAVLEICLSHHEKFDGSGYPHGLAGNDIPLVARIAAICDVYEALTTVRPYKRAWTQAEAIDTMIHSTGHFDPDLLKAFVSRMVISGTIH